MSRNSLSVLVSLVSLLMVSGQQGLTRENLKMTINAVYKGLERPSSMSIRGSGLGLSWNVAVPMTLQADGHTWSTDIVFKSSESGYTSQTCVDACDALDTGDFFKFRFYHTSTDQVETPMRGPEFRIKLPISEVSDFFEDGPSFSFYPFFFTDQGYNETTTVASGDPVIGSRAIVLYVPPGFEENPKPKYNLKIMFDLNQDVLAFFKPALDHIFDQVAPDAIIMGFGDWKANEPSDIGTDRTNLLTMTQGDMLTCKSGSSADLCGGCLPNSSLTNEEWVYWMTAGGCGQVEVMGGYADNTLDFLMNEALPIIKLRVEVMSLGQATIDEDRRAATIIGYSLGGLMSCYAAWTRPDVFGNGGCQSSSFWWPYAYNNSTMTLVPQFYLLNSVLPQSNDIRQRQRILIDVGGGEQDSISQMVTAAKDVFDFIKEVPGFEKDENLWFQVYPGSVHSFEAWQDRLWNLMKILD